MQPILVVEDDARLRQTVQLILSDEGWPVEVAVDGLEAIDRIVNNQPSLIVLDWGLPDRNAADVVAILRTTYGDGVPVLLMTADGRAAEKARRIGAFAFLHKPFDVDDLIDQIRTGLGSH